MLIHGGNPGPMLLLALRPAAPAQTPSGSILGWVLLAIVLAIIVASGVLLTSRR